MLQLIAPPHAPTSVPSDLRALGVTLRAARSAGAHARSAWGLDRRQAARDLAYVVAAADAALAGAGSAEPVAGLLAEARSLADEAGSRPAVLPTLIARLDTALAALGVLLDPFAPGGWTLACGDRCSILEVADVARSARASGVEVRLEADWLALAHVPSPVAQRTRREVSDGLAALRRRRQGAPLTVTLRPAGEDVVVDVAAVADDRGGRIARQVAA